MSPRGRLVLFAVVFIVVAALVVASGGDDTSAARHFLSALFRKLF